VRALVDSISPGSRTIVTSHDAFGYFAEAYGLRFEAPQGLSTEAEASAAKAAGLIRQIRDADIGAVFVETVADPRLPERIAEETGASIGGTLYADTLSPPYGPAPPIST
jgi:zinc/manganese transport system substrate-binding protein